MGHQSAIVTRNLSKVNDSVGAENVARAFYRVNMFLVPMHDRWINQPHVTKVRLY